MKHYLTPISILVLAISIYAGCWMLAKEWKEDHFIKQDAAASIRSTIDRGVQKPTLLMTADDLAVYLGINSEEALQLGPIPNPTGVTSELPYIQIGNQIYFSKLAVDEWLAQKGTVIVP
ncbi:helix-turn-helix domain-containing protein [Falsibacillus pallidus]|uniref:helix-turn-helix domain-containing protein n=1 Tax=Falsibacillus pallidus TaxID=493781 RepID=UPI003D95105E